jgi:ribosomal subunit interface protein
MQEGEERGKYFSRKGVVIGKGIIIRKRNSMMIHFTFLRGVEVESDTRRYVEKKLDTAGKVLEGLIKADVEIGQDKQDRFSVEVVVRAGRDIFRAEEERAESVESAIDRIEEKLREQIRDSRGKRDDLRLRGARSIKKSKVVDSRARF